MGQISHVEVYSFVFGPKARTSFFLPEFQFYDEAPASGVFHEPLH